MVLSTQMPIAIAATIAVPTSIWMSAYPMTPNRKSPVTIWIAPSTLWRAEAVAVVERGVTMRASGHRGRGPRPTPPGFLANRHSFLSANTAQVRGMRLHESLIRPRPSLRAARLHSCNLAPIFFSLPALGARGQEQGPVARRAQAPFRRGPRGRWTGADPRLREQGRLPFLRTRRCPSTLAPSRGAV